MEITEQDQLIEELREQFPLLEDLLFCRDDGGVLEPLPPAIALLSSMTNPDLPGDACVLLPSRERVAAFTAVLVALSAAKKHFPDLLRKYVSEGFEIGERVRVLPNGHVYLFGGFFDSKYGQFFKLKILDDDTNAARAFPIEEAVRLEKTEYKRPKGKGDRNWGEFELSDLDRLIGIRTGGNQALLSNEIMLVTTQNNFVDFLDHVLVAHKDRPDRAIPLGDLIPWGIVNSRGDIEFREGRAATGEPVIGVSPRAEYVALACKKSGHISPRVLVDGASRVKDLQAFDDIVDFSKLLVIADHSEVDRLPELANRNCSIWKMPSSLDGLVGRGDGLLKEFRSTFQRASSFEMKLVNCESEPIDEIAGSLLEAAAILEKVEGDETSLGLISIAYARLLDIASLVHDPAIEDLEDLRIRISKSKETLAAQKTWIDPRAFACLERVFSRLLSGLAPNSSEFRLGKQLALLEIVERLQATGSDLVVVGQNNVAAKSALRLLESKTGLKVQVRSLAELSDGEIFEDLVLTSWPRARNMSKLMYSYRTDTIHALAYGFEKKWFEGAIRRRKYGLSRWSGDEATFTSLTGLSAFKEVSGGIPEARSDITEFEAIFKFEERMRTVRKGTSAASVSEYESREGKYVGFAGESYCYLTDTHKVPCITGLIRGETDSKKGVPLVTVDQLSRGDVILFRGHSDADKDMIRFIAEHVAKPGEYDRTREIASTWKDCLREIGRGSYDVWKKLSAGGMEKTHQAVRGWLSDPNRIGPGDEADLHVIARIAANKEFEKKIPEVWSAIVATRGAHTTAGFKLSQLLFSNLAGQLPELGDIETMVDLTLEDIPLGQVVIVQVEDRGEGFEARPYWEVNKLLWDYD